MAKWNVPWVMSREALIKAQPHVVFGRAMYEHLSRFAEHTSNRDWVWSVHTEMPAFKAAALRPKPKTAEFTGRQAIVNLVIPVGATVVADPHRRVESRKMRTDCARVHSVIGVDLNATPARLMEVPSAYSIYASEFEYEAGALVVPNVRRNGKFSESAHTCASGIHFFLNVCDALAFMPV